MAVKGKLIQIGLKDTTGMTDWFERAGIDAFNAPYFDDSAVSAH